MTSEILAVPEEHLEDVILVIRNGLKSTKPKHKINREVRTQLTKWCKEEEDYLKRMNSGDIDLDE